MESKKSFILYHDQKDIFEHLDDKTAGKLIKHIFLFVNDESVVSDDPIVNIAFISIKSTIKRDTEKWRKELERASIAGIEGNLKRWNTELYMDYKAGKISLNEAVRLSEERKSSPPDSPPTQPDTPQSPPFGFIAVSVSDSVNVSVSDSVSEEKKESHDLRHGHTDNHTDLSEQKSMGGADHEFCAGAIEIFSEVTGKSRILNKGRKEMLMKIKKAKYTLDDIRAVCVSKYNEWKGDPKMEKHIEPDTLFRPIHFESYLEIAREKVASPKNFPPPPKVLYNYKDYETSWDEYCKKYPGHPYEKLPNPYEQEYKSPFGI